MNSLLVKQCIKEGVKSGIYPRYLFKYRSQAFLEDILERSRLKFSNPTEFNDPFDNQLVIKAELRDTNHIIKYVDLYHAGLSDTDKGILINKIISNPKFSEDVIKGTLKKDIEQKGICCFCSINDDITLWSYYADGHQGVCLKFDILRDLDFFSYPLVMKYNKDYPTYNYCTNPNELVNSLLQTKALCWKHEKEVRIIKKHAGFYKFKKEALTEIIFGYRCSPEIIQSTIKLVRSVKSNGLKYSQVALKKDEFGLEFKGIGV